MPKRTVIIRLPLHRPIPRGVAPLRWNIRVDCHPSFPRKTSNHRRCEVKKEALLAVTLMLISSTALAQTACPQGVSAGSAQCGPSTLVTPESGRANAPSLPEVKWADSWGAIASDGVSTYGIVTDFPSKRKAQKAAIAECKKRGGGRCTVARSFYNQCAVVVAGDSGTNIVNARTVKRATDLAMRDCEAEGNNRCWTFWSG